MDADADNSEWTTVSKKAKTEDALESSPSCLDNIYAQNGKYFLALKTRQTLAVLGHIRLRCKLGRINLFGSIIDQSRDWIEIKSYTLESLICIATESEVVEKEEKLDFVSKTGLSEIVDQIESDELSAVIELDRLSGDTRKKIFDCMRCVGPPESFFVTYKMNESFDSKTRFPVKRKGYLYLSQECALIDCHVRSVVDEGNVLNTSNEFWPGVKRLVEDARGFAQNSAPVILVAGDRDTGKSTIVRFVINTLLNDYDKVQALECDIGQSEYNFPGSVGLVTVRDPVLGPQFTRIGQSSGFSIFLGSTSPSKEEFSIASEYNQALEMCFNSERDTSVPLVINTMGWIERTGLQFIRHCIIISRPHLVIDLGTFNLDNSRREFYIKDRVLHNLRGMMKPTSEAAAKKQLVCMNYRLFPMPRERSLKSVKNNLRRMMTKTAYFRSNMTSFWIDMSSIGVFMFNRSISPKFMFRVLNLCIVGLGRIAESELRELGEKDDIVPNEKNPKYVENFPLTKCVGWAIVIGIDMSERRLKLLTPEPEEFVRENVNLLFGGCLETPENLKPAPSQSMYRKE